MVIYYIEHVYLRPYVYSFCQIFQALRLFPALRLLRTLEYIKFDSKYFQIDYKMMIVDHIHHNCIDSSTDGHLMHNMSHL